MEQLWEQIKERKFLVIGLGGLLTILLVYFSFSQSSKEEPNPLLTSPSTSQIVEQESTPSSASSQEVSRQPLVVDVKGAVQKEGIYQLPAGSRVDDAIKAAGGLTEVADKKSVNLAQKLTDASVVYVASQGENISVVTAQTTSNNEGSSASNKVNINQASLSELQTISGIGAKRAQDIIDYRESNGGFKNLEDLKKVAGIGEKTFEKLKELIRID